jgi:hypothetical protein
MIREEFIQALEDHNYSYEIEGDKIVVTHKGDIILFNNFDSIPSGVEFNSNGVVYLYELKDLPSGVIFNNKEEVVLDSIENISPDVKFNNSGNIRLELLGGIWFDKWKGNIKGIGYRRLLNKMVSLGLFDKKR